MSVTPTLEPSRRRSEGCASDLRLDRLLVGELDDAEGAALEAHLATCAPCAARRQALAAERGAFSGSPPVQARPLRTRDLGFGAVIGGALALAASLLVVPAPPPDVRLKGAEKLELVVRHPDGRQEAVLPGGALSPDDAVRFRVSMDRAAHVAVVSLDAAGVVTVYAPTEGGTARLPASRGLALDGSTVLDETLGAERITALFCERPVDRDALVAAGRRAMNLAAGDPVRASPLALPCRQASFLVKKVPRP